MINYLISVIEVVAQLYIMLIVIKSVKSWLRQDVIYSMLKFFNIVDSLVNPFLRIIKKMFPTTYNRIDFAPVIGIVLVLVVKTLLIMLVKMLLDGTA